VGFIGRAQMLFNAAGTLQASPRDNSVLLAKWAQRLRLPAVLPFRRANIKLACVSRKTEAFAVHPEGEKLGRTMDEFLNSFY